MILHFVRSNQNCVAGNQCSLLGDHVIMTAAAMSLGERHIRALLVSVATMTQAGAEGDKSTERLSKHTHTHTDTHIYTQLPALSSDIPQIHRRQSTKTGQLKMLKGWIT